MEIEVSKEIDNFVATYKELEGKKTLTLGWHDRETAQRVIEEAQAAGSTTGMVHG